MSNDLVLKRNRRRANLKQTASVFFGRGPIVVISFVILLVFLFVSIFAQLIEPYDPLALDYTIDGKLQSPSAEHPFGTDALGRDVLSRIISGAQISLVTSVLSGTLAAVIGILIGLIAGYFGKVVNVVIMRLVDMMLSIPSLVFAMIISFVLQGGVLGIVVGIGFTMIPTYVRMVNGQVAALKENDYITAAEIVGQKKWKIILKHLFPNCFPSLIVLYTMNLGSAIMTESSLSYLGVGINPPQATWGGMVADGYNCMTTSPWLCFLPGVCVILVVIAFNVVGDSLRDALDPRLRGKL